MNITSVYMNYYCTFAIAKSVIKFIKMKKIYFILIALVLMTTACKKTFTVNVDNSSIGKAAEVLLVMDKDVWKQTIQDSVNAMLTVPQPAINQIEPMFDVLQIPTSEFNSDKQRHFNVIQFELSENLTKTELSIERGIWSTPQIYIKIRGNNQDSCLTYFVNHQVEIRDELYANDIRKIQGAYEGIANIELQEHIKNKFGILLTVTKEYSIAREEDDFLWLAYRTSINDRFIMIYRSDSTNLSKRTVINNRNRMSRKYIEGAANENIHPIVTEIADLPLAQPLQIGMKKGIELRGLWETENDYMGGPFYHFSYVNAQNQCISIDGFVYAPTESKRNYLRQVEAIVKSVK